MVSDNGPRYTSQVFAEFAKDYEFRHITSSPYFPQGNGEAERAVGTIKRLLEKGGDPYKARLAYRCTPLPQIGYSPSQLLMGRVLQSSVPTSQAQRRPQLSDLARVRVRDCQGKARQKSNHDRHHGARSLPPLQTGDRVWIPQREQEGEIREEVSSQSYTVETEGDTIRRNRRHFIRLPHTERAEDPTESVEEDTSSNSSSLNNPTQTNNSNDSSDSHNSNDTNNEQLSEASVHPPVCRSGRHSHPPERFDPSWGN